MDRKDLEKLDGIAEAVVIGLLAAGRADQESPAALAKRAYDIAEALLAERQKRQPQKGKARAD